MAADDAVCGLSGPQDFDYLLAKHLGLSERHRHGPLSNRTGPLFWPKSCSGTWLKRREARTNLGL